MPCRRLDGSHDGPDHARRAPAPRDTSNAFKHATHQTVIRRQTNRKFLLPSLYLATFLSVPVTVTAAEDGVDQFVQDLKSVYGTVVEKLGGNAASESTSEPATTPDDDTEAAAQVVTEAPETDATTSSPPPQLYDPALVMAIQAGLAEHGYEPGQADGVFGRRTESAIRAFQTRQGLVVDGLPTRSLLTSLNTLPTPEVRKSTSTATAPEAPSASTTEPPADDDDLPPVSDLTIPPEPAISPATAEPLAEPLPNPAAQSGAAPEQTAEPDNLPEVDTLAVNLGMTVEQAAAVQPELQFIASNDPGGIKRLAANGRIESASFLARLERGHIGFQFRADPFARQIYWIQRLVDLGQPVPIEEIRGALVDKYGEAEYATVRRMCWGQCDTSARILSHARGRSVSMELTGLEPEYTNAVRMVLWDGSVAARARDAADAAITQQPVSEPVAVDRAIDSL